PRRWPAWAPPFVPSPTPTLASGAVQIAGPGSLQVGEGLDFVNAQTGEPGVLVRLASGYVAYSAVCTHQGCTVGYSPARHLLACPCHGALYDPAAGAVPVRGPARRPLPPLAIQVQPDGSVDLAG
ncbi:MAG TPA: Rieske (2Fe-2S) protein, partial [Chloroflexia bacterium]|nr:Rieske (2Fe-2S) protein [Chloroflexia bacterium]